MAGPALWVTQYLRISGLFRNHHHGCMMQNQSGGVGIPPTPLVPGRNHLTKSPPTGHFYREGANTMLGFWPIRKLTLNMPLTPKQKLFATKIASGAKPSPEFS